MNSSDEDINVVNTEYEHADESQLIETADGGLRVGNIYIAPPGKPYSAENASRPRLIITKIMNNNFKSYVGEVQLGPFHECFNAIIGPNGSGKSNVIDSMLFVFGYRANKIRCKNLKVLLHKSTTHGQKKTCHVEIHFKQIIEKNGKYETVPDSEFFISRSANCEGTLKSCYTINNETASFTEVANLLKTHHVDLLHNRFLILQGEVESIAMMKCKGQNENETGLLEYLEDIIGTTRFKKPLAKIDARIFILSDERTEKYNRCKLSEREMNDLTTPYQIAIAYINSENDFIRAKNLYVQKYVSDHKNQLRQYLGIYDDITTKLRAHDEQIKMIVEEKIIKESQIQQEIAAHEEMLKEKEDLKQSLTSLRNNQKGIQVLVDSTIKRRKTVTNQITKEETNIVDYKKVPDRNSQEIVECEQKTEKVTKQLADAERTFEENLISLRELTQPLVEAKEKLEIEMDHLLKTVDESKSEYQLAESTLQILLHSETTEIRKYETLKNSYEDSRKSFNEKQLKLQNSNINGLKQMVVAKEEELRNNKNEEKKLSQQYRIRRADIDEKSQALQRFKSNNKVLDFIMKLKFEGILPGVLGRLGDLGGIDAKYDVAISTCCGRLDNIIVDTVSTAQQCIEHLKRSNVGRATFVALEKVAHLIHSANQPINTPENAPRIYDLIKVEDERILPAFYFSVRNTIVANDLEQATRIGYGEQRFRVITLKGELIEVSGTMSGGGKQFLRGRMGESVRTKTSANALNSSLTTKNLDRLKVETEEMRDRINYLQEIQGKLENEIQKLKYDIKKEENEYKYARVEIKNLEEQLPRIEEQLKNQKLKMEQTKADPIRVKEMKLQLEEKRKIFEQSESAAKQKGIQVSKISKEIETIQSTKLKSVKKKIDEYKQLLIKLTKNISELKVEITTSSRKLVKAEQKVRDLNNDLTKCRETLEKSEIDIKANDEKITKLNHHLTQIVEKIETTKTDSSDIKKQVDAFQKQINKGQLKRLEYEKEIQVAEKQIAEARIQVPHWENQLSLLKLQLIPNQPRPPDLKVYSKEELSKYQTHDLQYNCSVQESNLSKVTPNLSVIDEYDRKREVYLERVKILEEITNKRNLLRNVHSTLKTKRYVEFTKGFQIITTKLKEMYQMITQGGDAELELVDSMDPFHEGVAFSVRPPKKSWKSISNLSGGEKTLSSLALVFALHYYKPSPLYFMDEIDAALDFRNVSIVANYIKNRTKDAQFIIISLRSNMFELSDCLTGIYKVDESTDALMINNVRPCNSTQQQNGIVMPNNMVNGNDSNNNNDTNSNSNNHSNNGNNNISNNDSNNNSHNNINNNNNSVNNHEETDNNEVVTSENNETVVNSGNLNTSPIIQNCSTSSLSSASASPSSKQHTNHSLKRSGLEINTDNDEADDTSVSVLSNDSTVLNTNADNDNDDVMSRPSKKMRTS